MPKLTKFQTSFDFGEISPRLLARVDLAAYGKATKTMDNCYSLVHGGATKRRGTLFSGPLFNEAQIGRLIPFIFDVTRTFMLVLNGGKIEFAQDLSYIETSPGVRYQLTIPYTESELKQVQFAQSGNTMYLVHPNHPPKLLQRITDTDWTLTDIPFVYKAVSDVTFSNAFISFKIINGSNKFNVGDYFTITTSGGGIATVSGPVLGGGTPPGNGQIAGVISMPGSTTSETWTITCSLSTTSRQEWTVVGSVSGSPAAYWKSGNYPQTVSFFEQRLFFGGSAQFPQHIWGSGAGDYLNFTVGNRDSDGVIVQIAGNDYNALTHLVSARSLLPLTYSTEFSMAGPGNGAISGISSNIIKDHTRNGSNSVRPLRIDREIVFLQRDGKKARAISYSVTEDANQAPDITLFAEHMTRNAKFTDMAFSANPDSVAWLVRSDGSLCSLTHVKDLDTTAWAQHHTLGSFEAVAKVDGLTADDVYFIVKRTINGVERRYLECFDYVDNGQTTDTCFSDSAVIYDGAPTTTIAGLSHLEGCTVTAIADGVVVPDMVVDGGSVELGFPASYVTVGLPYTTTLEMLDPEFGDSSQSTASRAIAVEDIIVKFQDTVGANINGVAIPFRSVGQPLDVPTLPFTGSKKVKSLGWRSPNNILITSTTPTPFTVLGVVITALVN